MSSHQQHAAAQAVFAADQEAEKKRLIKLCNVARADRKWTDDEWGQIKRQHGHAASLTEMEIDDLEAVLDHAKRCGFKVQHATKSGGESRPIDRTDPARKLRKLWLRGHALGIIKSADESALCGWVSNSHSPNVTALLQSFGPAEWDAAIERLKQWLFQEVQRGRLHCPEHTHIVPRKAATDVIWERPVKCACGKPMEWRPGPKREQRYGRRG